MTDTAAVAQQLVDALARQDAAALEQWLHPDARLRQWGWNMSQGHRPRDRVVSQLSGEWANWPDLEVETASLTVEGERAVVEVRLRGTDPGSGRYVEHNRALIVNVEDGLAHTLDFYCAEPLPSAPRHPLPAPAGLTEAELRRLFELQRYEYDPRVGLSLNESGYSTLRGHWSFGASTHPASNFVGGARWTHENADANIEAMLERFRQRGAGFQWWVSPYDTPADLPERLERHGLVRAGGYEKMARLNLTDLSDIPVNPDLTVEPVDGSDPAAFDSMMRVIEVAFNEPPEHAAQMAAHVRERLADPTFRNENVLLLARLDGQPVGTARIILRGTMGYLVAGSTLPEFRGRHVYSTLLRRRLEIAYERGFNIVSLDAGPMSRRVVERFGFRPFGMTHVYGWMPEMDLEVIRALVPQE